MERFQNGEKMRYVSIDIETTGLDIDSCDLLEFGAVIDNLADQKPVNELPFFHCYFMPPNGQTFQGQPYALSMHQTIFRRIAERTPPYTYVSPSRFGNLFKRFLVDNGHSLEHDRCVISVAGKNFGACDLQFLNKKTDLAKHVEIRHRIIDPAILLLDPRDESLPGTDICKARMKAAGIATPEGIAHTAIEDALDVIRMTRYGLRNVFPILVEA